MKESLYIGIDLGTGSLKGIVVTYSGSVIAKSTASYDVISPHLGYSEQDPKDWYEAFEKVLFQLIADIPSLKDDIRGIAISGQMHSLVMLDAKGHPVRNAILWNDVRNAIESKFLNEKYGSLIRSETGNRSFEGFTLPKILWMRDHEIDNYQTTHSILLPKDYLVYRLTGQRVMDYSDASGTLLLNINTRTWSTKMLDTFGISSTLLPRLVRSDEKVGTMSEALVEHFGFHGPVNIYGGGADNACGALGAGVVDESKQLISIGTSGVILGMGSAMHEDTLHNFLHVNGERYQMGVTLSAGDSLNWIKEIVAPEQAFDAFVDDNYGKRPVHPMLLFTPYLRGERCPHPDAFIRGSFIGLDSSHSRRDMVQAVMEGVVFSLRESFDRNKSAYLISIGGGAKSSAWLQIQANILQSPIVTLTTEEGPALGAAMLVAVGSGDYENYNEVVKQFIRYSKDTIIPSQEHIESYERLYQSYIKIYNATKDFFV
ncbi:xylulokinase [Erysipelothrix sp. HDW6C]|uniref:xylulokinase n=1 Tax=Erysipelothrix sp. HDW6C TaxID=2714930 RepID=UPI00140AFBCE|nr:xylulokinase [Erysipelothrix sp. HDW6C]QIK70660.1 xylulokinase [Erysipelothrix sp. HDW6C]